MNPLSPLQGKPGHSARGAGPYWREDRLLWKRVLDLGCMVVSAPIWLPLGGIVAALIAISSPGPVLFKQERVGYRARRFVCLKFRTMQVGADAEVHRRYLNGLMHSDRPMTKLEVQGDARLIPFGLLLRSLGLDELPQLINVLRGEMSLVGPRPCIPYEFEQYEPRHQRRCNTPPGLTGLWQVSGKNRTTFEQMMNLDLTYIAKRSLAFDLRIIVMTAPALLIQAMDLRRARQRGKAVTGGGGETGPVSLRDCG